MSSDHALTWILDVGHGSATVIEQRDHVTIIDGGRGDALLTFLEERNIHKIDTIIISHVDADHLGGISLLLLDSDFTVGNVYLNPDPRDTALWRDFISTMRDAKSRGAAFSLELTTVNPGTLAKGDVRLEILAPSQEVASRTPAGRDEHGRRLNANAMSAVVRVWTGDKPRVLAAGDIDDVGFANLEESTGSLQCDVLLFPHHGGLPGKGDPGAFAANVTRAVAPSVIVFSTGRGVHGTPRPEIIAAVRREAPDAYLACTQLSERCSLQVPAAQGHLGTAHARGKQSRACCAGTLLFPLAELGSTLPAKEQHLAFVDGFVPTALCRGRGVVSPDSSP